MHILALRDDKELCQYLSLEAIPVNNARSRRRNGKGHSAYVSQLRTVNLCENSPNPNFARRARNATWEPFSISQLIKLARHNRAALRNSCL